MPPTTKLARANVTARAKRIDKKNVTHAGAPPAGPEGPDGPSPTAFEVVCEEIRERLQAVDEISEILIKDYFSVADLLAKAKLLYEETTGTGHGKRNPARIPSFPEFIGPKVGRDPSSIQRYCRLAQADQKTREMIVSSTIRGNLTTLLEVVREPDPEVRAQAIVAFDEGGSKAAKAVLAGSNPLAERAERDPAFRALLDQLLDPKTTLGGIPDDVPIPKSFVDKYDVLALLPTMAAFREAARGLKAVARVGSTGKAPKAKAASVETVVVSVAIGSNPQRLAVKDASFTVRVASIEIPRAALERALADTGDDGSSKSGDRKSVNLDMRKLHDFPLITSGTVKLVVG